MGRRKELPLLEKVRITDIGAEGNALARVDNLVVFVPMLIPGDVVDIRVVRKRKKYLEGRVVKFHEYSPDRIEPRCKHFGVCGGCKWQHLPYDLQLKYKEKQVRDNLTRIGKIDQPEINPIIGSPMYFCTGISSNTHSPTNDGLHRKKLILKINLKRKMLWDFIFPDYLIKFWILRSAIFSRNLQIQSGMLSGNML